MQKRKNNTYKIAPGALHKLLHMHGLQKDEMYKILDIDKNDVTQETEMILVLIIESIKHLNDKLENIKQHLD